MSTMPGVPAIMTPIAGDMAAASGLPIETVLMTIVVGFSTVFFPYQVPPLIVVLQLANIPARAAAGTALLTAVPTILILLPLDYLWWRVLGLLPCRSFPKAFPAGVSRSRDAPAPYSALRQNGSESRREKVLQ